MLYGTLGLDAGCACCACAWWCIPSAHVLVEVIRARARARTSSMPQSGALSSRRAVSNTDGHVWRRPGNGAAPPKPGEPKLQAAAEEGRGSKEAAADERRRNAVGMAHHHHHHHHRFASSSHERGGGGGVPGSTHPSIADEFNPHSSHGAGAPGRGAKCGGHVHQAGTGELLPEDGIVRAPAGPVKTSPLLSRRSATSGI